MSRTLKIWPKIWPNVAQKKYVKGFGAERPVLLYTGAQSVPDSAVLGQVARPRPVGSGCRRAGGDFRGPGGRPQLPDRLGARRSIVLSRVPSLSCARSGGASCAARDGKPVRAQVHPAGERTAASARRRARTEEYGRKAVEAARRGLARGGPQRCQCCQAPAILQSRTESAPRHAAATRAQEQPQEYALRSARAALEPAVSSTGRAFAHRRASSPRAAAAAGQTCVANWACLRSVVASE